MPLDPQFKVIDTLGKNDNLGDLSKGDINRDDIFRGLRFLGKADKPFDQLFKHDL